MMIQSKQFQPTYRSVLFKHTPSLELDQKDKACEAAQETELMTIVPEENCSTQVSARANEESLAEQSVFSASQGSSYEESEESSDEEQKQAQTRVEAVPDIKAPAASNYMTAEEFERRVCRQLGAIKRTYD